MSDRLPDGSSSPLGATPSPTGVNFSVFSRHATGMELLLFDAADDPKPARVLRHFGHRRSGTSFRRGSSRAEVRKARQVPSLGRVRGQEFGADGAGLPYRPRGARLGPR